MPALEMASNESRAELVRGAGGQASSEDSQQAPGEAEAAPSGAPPGGYRRLRERAV